MRHAKLLLLAGLLAARLATPALADDPEFDQMLEDLPEVVVRAPGVFPAPGRGAPAETATALRHWSIEFDTPSSVTVQDGASIRQRRMSRSLPDALLFLPGVLVQKTAPLQSSPFIRGFTGYRNLLLIDGIRLNNAAFRAGPSIPAGSRIGAGGA